MINMNRPGISKEYTNRMRELRSQANAHHAANKIQGGARGFLTRKKLKQNQLAALQREYLMRYKKLLNNRERLLKQQLNVLTTPNSNSARRRNLAKKARAARMEKRKNKLQVRNRLSSPKKLTNLITGEVKIYKTKRFYEQALNRQLLIKKRICG